MAMDSGKKPKPPPLPMDLRYQQAAEAGNLEKLMKRIYRRRSTDDDVVVDLDFVSRVNEKRENFLHIAARFNQLLLAKELCKVKIFLARQQNKNGDTPLHCAAREGHQGMIQLLLDGPSTQTPAPRPGEYGPVGFDSYIMMRNEDGRTALHEALINGHADAAKYLMKQEPRLSSVVDFHRNSPLSLAVEKEMVDVARALLKCPHASMATRAGGRPWVYILRWRSHEDCPILGIFDVESLLSIGDQKGLDSTLLEAARLGKTNVIKEMHAKEKIMLCKTTAGNNTAFHVAATYGQLKFSLEIIKNMKWLIAVQNSRGDTPLHCASRSGDNHQLVSHIIDLSKTFVAENQPSELKELHMYALLRTKNVDGDTALHVAARRGHVQVAKKLMEAFPELSSIVNNAGESPLYLAVEGQYLEIVNDLLNLQYDNVSHEGPYGQTTLHAAVLRKKEIMKLLLEKKRGLVTTEDRWRSTPLHYAAANGEVLAIEQLLQSSEKKVAYIKDSDGCPPIHAAAKMGHIDAIKKLIACCPDCCELVDNDGRTFLHMAIKKDKAEVVKYVLKTKGLENLINERDDRGETPLHLAVAYKNEKIVRLLLKDKRVLRNSRGNDEWHSTPLDLACGMRNESTGIRSYNIILDLWYSGSRFSPSRCDHALTNREQINHEQELQRCRALVNNLSIVAVLIATVTFAAAFTVPGGYNGNVGPDQGNALLAKRAAFKAFLISDTIALMGSIIVTALLIYTASRDHDVRDQSIRVSLYLFWIALGGMMLAFATGAYVVAKLDNKLMAIAVVIMACSVPVIALLLVWMRPFWPLSFAYLMRRLTKRLPKHFKAISQGKPEKLTRFKSP